MKNNLLSLKAFLLTGLLLTFSCTSTNDPLQLADPFVGTGLHGHTYPGAAAPFGMVQLSPDTRNDGWDGVSGYHAEDNTIIGFSHTHLSGTGEGDMGDFLFVPGTGTVKSATCTATNGEMKPQRTQRAQRILASPQCPNCPQCPITLFLSLFIACWPSS